MPARTASSELLHIVWIKTSHYDDDGYVIQWYRSSLPANSLASVYAIALDCAERQVLGPDVEIRLHAIDETNTRVDPKRLVKKLKKLGGRILVGMVGVQSNQFPRALDLARQFRALDIPVAIGGFHVSGSLAMLKEMPVELKEALDLGITLYAGELEGRLEILLRDLMQGGMNPLYNYLGDLPE